MSLLFGLLILVAIVVVCGVLFHKTSHGHHDKHSTALKGPFTISQGSTGQWYGFDNHTQAWVANPATINTGRTAVLVHGFISDQRIMIEMGKFLAAYTFPQTGKGYANILCYKYDYTLNVKTSGTSFAQDLASSHIESSIDLFAHGLGGLLSRYAVEATSFGGTRHVRNIVFFGTPNNGIPSHVLQTFDQALAQAGVPASVYGAADMVLDSPFLTELNNNTHFHHNPNAVNYYCIAGNSPATLLPRQGTTSVGQALDAIYSTMNAADDGLVSVTSVEDAHLSRFSHHWSASNPKSNAIVNQDHTSMLGVVTQITPFAGDILATALYVDVPDQVQTALRAFLPTFQF